MARKFRFEWRITVLTVILLPGLVGLGFWQWHRADTNRIVLAQADEQHKKPPVFLVDLLPEIARDIASKNTKVAWRLTPVVWRGQWLEKSFLLENQIYDERNGYYVFGVMRLDNNQGLVLVNRGWLPAPALRNQLPIIPPVTTTGSEVGEIYESLAWRDEKPIFAESGSPKRVGRMNLVGAEQALQSTLLPVLVRLTPTAPSALATQWPIVNIQPEKNTAYAVQWFAMAFALLLCYGFYSFRVVANNTANFVK